MHRHDSCCNRSEPKGLLDSERVMQTRARFLGHPVHPLLVTFPLGLLLTATCSTCWRG